MFNVFDHAGLYISGSIFTCCDLHIKANNSHLCMSKHLKKYTDKDWCLATHHCPRKHTSVVSTKQTIIMNDDIMIKLSIVLLFPIPCWYETWIQSSSYINDYVSRSRKSNEINKLSLINYQYNLDTAMYLSIHFHREAQWYLSLS